MTRLTLTLIICLSAIASFGQTTNRPFQIKFTPGLDFAHFYFGNSPEYRKTNIRLGAEAEFYLPYDQRKNWGLFIEPAYQSFSQENVAFRYESIEVSLGARCRLYIKNKGAFFFNVISLIDVPLQHSQRYSLGGAANITLQDDTIEPGFAGGLGYSYSRVSIEGRYYTRRTREDTHLPLEYHYGKISMILGFRLF